MSAPPEPRSWGPEGREGAELVIGLINNMPDAALQTTERQFHALLSAATGDHLVRLRVFSLPELHRAEAGRLYVDRNYEDISELWGGCVDGLIVTGTEPRAAALENEPYWPHLTRLIDWAEARSIPTIWSCLAAHAAVLHLDGVRRRPRAEKLSGVFSCDRVADHALLSGVPGRWGVPHSRHNDLPEEALTAAGYSILSRSPDVGADMFTKRRGGLFLFVQGHPEYDAGALLREYRRDIGRFLAGERENYPKAPSGYFNDAAMAALDDFSRQARRRRHIDQLANFPMAIAEANLIHDWGGFAARLYTNWLSHIAEEKYRPITQAATSGLTHAVL